MGDASRHAGYRPDCWDPRDNLGFSDFCPALLRILMKTETPLTVGVFGPWESGKTILLRMLKEEVDKNDEIDDESRHSVLTVWFTAWKYECHEYLWRTFTLRVLDSLYPREKSEDARERRMRVPIEDLDERRKEQVDHLDRLALSLCALEQPTKMEQFKAAFQEILRLRLKENGRLIIFVDGLDLCLPGKAMEMLEAIRLFLGVSGTVFVLGMDREVIQQGVEARYGASFQEKGAEQTESAMQGDPYLQKAVQISLQLPSLAVEDLDKYILTVEKGKHADDRLGKMTRTVFARGLYPDPRQVRQALSVFRLLKGIVLEREKRPESEGGLRPNSIAWPLLAKTVLIQTQWPELYQDWRQYPTLVQILEAEYTRRVITEEKSLGDRRPLAPPLVRVEGEVVVSDLISPYLTDQRRYTLLERMLAFPLPEEGEEVCKRARFEGLSRDQITVYTWLASAMGASESIMEAPAELLAEMLSGDRARIRDAIERLKGEEPEQKGPLHQNLRDQLLRLIRDPARTVNERTSAGNTLALIGDPRFDPDASYLPKVYQGKPELLLGFVEIPAGDFEIGTRKSQRDVCILLNRLGWERYWYEREKPHKRGRLGLRYVARYLVTVAQFRAFVEASRYKPTDKNSLRGLDNHPAVWVTWHDAMAYCRWLTERLRRWEGTPEPLAHLLREEGWVVILPSEAEWEKTARGGLEFLDDPKNEPPPPYPWGDMPDPARANCADTGLRTTSAVGCFPDGASPYGVEDLSGNVWEWTRSLYRKYPYDPGKDRKDSDAEGLRVMRGGSFSFVIGCVRSAIRFGVVPDNCGDDLGFRVVISPG